jgi:hypothetical protein
MSKEEKDKEMARRRDERKAVSAVLFLGLLLNGADKGRG